MGTVKVTDTLRSEIRTRISTMRSKALEPFLLGPFDETHPATNTIADEVERDMWRDATDLRGKIPDRWLRTTGRFTLVVTEIDVPTVELIALCERPTPPGNGYHRHMVTLRPSKLSDAARELYDRSLVQVKKQAVVNTRFNKVEADIKALLDQCPTLNRALKLVPELEMYVPEDRMEKIREKRGRADTTTPQVELDRDNLVAVGVGSRITSSR